MLILVGILTLLVVSLEADPIPRGQAKAPVVLVPGDGGSQFEAKLTGKPSTVHYWCEKQTDDWFPLWLNIELLAPLVLDCTVDNLRMVYNATTRTSSNSPGVLTRQPGFGNTSSVEWLDSSHLYDTDYYYPIVEALVKLGWKRDANIHGAPYDFRLAPNENKQYFGKLKSLIETTYKDNGNRRIILIGHSMGNLYVLYLLNQQSQSWKDKYISSFIDISGPLGGAAKLIRLMASGDNLGVFAVNPLSARPEQRSMPSSAWLLPYDTFWNETEVLAYTPKYNYTVKDYKRFFEDVNFMDGYEMRKDTEALIYKQTPPGVEVHCLHGVNVSTPEQFTWTASSWFDDQPKVKNGNGDGTVNLRSLHGCLRWKTKQSQNVYHQDFPGVDHMRILRNQPTVDYIVKVAKSASM